MGERHLIPIFLPDHMLRLRFCLRILRTFLLFCHYQACWLYERPFLCSSFCFSRPHIVHRFLCLVRKLLDDDLKYVEGKEDQLLARLQKVLGKSKDEVGHLLRKIDEKLGNI